jgi:hypothetical protein
MSKSVEKASEKVPDEPQKNFVYDFLYCDTRRIGSYLSQFDDSGLLEKVIQRETASKDAKRGVSLNVGGGASLAGTEGSGSFGFNLTPGVGGSESSERVYDPYWANALTLLDFLADREILRRDLSHAGIGQFVLIEGSLSIIDMSIAKSMFSNPSIKKILLSSNEESSTSTTPQFGMGDRVKAQKQKERQAAQERLDAVFNLVNSFPFTVQANLITENKDTIWCTLRDECLIVKAVDLLLQHGVFIQGEWNIVGILDAKRTYFEPKPLSHAALDQPIASALAQLAPLVRAGVGRPDSAHGVTPLMVFRKVV